MPNIMSIVKKSSGGNSVVVAATEPASPRDGMFWLDTVSNNLYCYRGGDWWNIGTLDNPDIVVGVGRRSALWFLLPNIAS